MAVAGTQQFLEVDHIREGVVILKNKSFRGVLMVSSVNFVLKSEDEQTALLYQFLNFLNSLDFSVEILIQSRRVNITGYLDQIKKLEDRQQNDLLKMQTAEYRKFINNLIGGGNVLSKSFYVVVPYTPISIPGTGKKKAEKKATSLNEEKFAMSKAQLLQRVEFVMMGLRSCGLKAIPLNTAELIELFWSTYNPDQASAGYYPEIPENLKT